MTIRPATLGGALVLGALVTSLSMAQGAPLKIKEEKAGLLKQATIAPAAAQQTAQAKYPTGKITEGEIEREDGKLIYSFAIQLPGVKGTEEVNIDAMTGRILTTEHEDAAAEAKEKAAERAKPKPKKPTPF